MYIVVGDSWGCGEWIDGKITHGGIAEYLENAGCDVINRSSPGGSNLDSLYALKNILTCECSAKNLSNLDAIFLFWTEWYRDFKIKPHGIFHLAKEALDNNYAEYFTPNKLDENFYGVYQERILLEFAKIAKNLKTKIFVIGGASDLDYFDNNCYKDVICACQSFTNLIINNIDTVSDPVYYVDIWPEKFIKNVKKDKNISLEFLLNQLQIQEDRKNLLKCYQTEFFLDKQHPNRQAHLKLLDLLIKKKILPKIEMCDESKN